MQPPFWVFLELLIESVPELKFAAASERETNSWIYEFQFGNMVSKNAQSKKTDSENLIKHCCRVPLEESIRRNQVVDTLLHSEKSHIYEEPDDLVFDSNPIMSTVHPFLNQFDHLSVQSDISDDGVENAIFCGSREDAFSELTRCPPLGSYHLGAAR